MAAVRSAGQWHCSSRAPAAIATATADMKGKTPGALRQYAAACSASLMAMTTGAWLGWPSPALPKLLANETSLVMTSEQLSWVVSLFEAGCGLSPIPGGLLMDFCGRRKTILFTGVFYFISWIIVFVASTPTILYCGRFLAGLSRGVSLTVVPVYLGEITSPSIRGAVSTVFVGLLWIGIMFEYSVGPFVSYNTLNLLSTIMPILFLTTFVFMPESPYYLVMRHRYEDAYKALQWLRNSPRSTSNLKYNPSPTMSSADPMEHELEEMKKNVAQDMEYRGKFSDLVCVPSNRKATIIVLTVSEFQRICGSGCLLAYSSITLPDTHAFIGPHEIIILFGVILTVSNFLATPLIDRLGRKPLLIFSGAGCGITTAVSAVFFYFYERTSVDTSRYFWVPYASLCLFGLAHSIGIGVIPHTLLGELYPQNVKRYAAAAAAISFSISSFITNKLYVTVQINFGVYVMFSFFAFMGLTCALFSYYFVFETKGKSFAEIQAILQEKQESSGSNVEQRRITC